MLLEIPEKEFFDIVHFCNSIDLLLLKNVSRQTNLLVKKYITKIPSLFINKADFWCQVIMNPFFEMIIKYFIRNYDPDEHFIVATGILLSSNLVKDRINNFSLINRYDKHQQSQLVLNISGQALLEFDLLKLLNVLEKVYDDDTIKRSIINLRPFLSKTKKPYYQQSIDVSGDEFDLQYNPEEFFWCPEVYVNEDYFVKDYPNITKNIL